MSKKDKPLFHKRNGWQVVFNILFLLIILIVLGNLIGILWSLVAKLGGSTGQELPMTYFALILTGITVAIGSSIIIPQIALKRSVDDAVRSAVDEKAVEIEQKYRDEFDKKYLNEIRRLDAHLSRMTAYFLVRERSYAWSIGWILRSARRYYLLNRYTVDMESYSDLMKLLLEHLNEAITAVAISSSSSNMAQVVSAMEDVLSGQDAKETERKVRIVIRMLKDYFDLEMALKKEFRESRKRPTLMERIMGKKETAIEMRHSRKEVVQIMQTVGRFVLAFIYTIRKSAVIGEFTDDLATEISEISYSEIWDDIDGSTYREQLRGLINRIEKKEESELLQHVLATADETKVNFVVDFGREEQFAINYVN